MNSDYPRDMRGYGQRPPNPRWPGGARLALQFVINYEEGGESSILHGDPASEAYLGEIVGRPSLAGARDMSAESVYEYGTRAGFWRLHRLFSSRNIPVTVFAVAMALERCPDAVKAMQAAHWEVASHGYRWIDYQHIDEQTERTHLEAAIDAHTRITGERPLGWYCGRTSPNTRRLVVERGGFLYDADSYADDLPYWSRGYSRPHLVVPYTLDNNDMRFATVQGFNAGDQFFNYLQNAFDVLYEEGLAAPKMMSVGLHCRLAGRPGRAHALARFLDYVQAKPDIWVSRRVDIARHWWEHHLPPEIVSGGG